MISWGSVDNWGSMDNWGMISWGMVDNRGMVNNRCNMNSMGNWVVDSMSNWVMHCMSNWVSNNSMVRSMTAMGHNSTMSMADHMGRYIRGWGGSSKAKKS